MGDNLFKKSLKQLIEESMRKVDVRHSVFANAPKKPKSSSIPSSKLSPKEISLAKLNPDIMEAVKAQMLKLENSKYTLEEYRFVDGIPEEKIAAFPARLLQNKNALYYLTEKTDYIVNKDIDYFWLSSNTNPVAIELIKKALEDDDNTHIYWAELCKNPSAADILLDQKYRLRLEWGALSRNTNTKVINFLARNSPNINWENLSANESPAAIALLKRQIKTNPMDVYRHHLSRNSGATELLKEYPEKVVGDGVSGNRAEDAYALLTEQLKEHPKDINWYSLSANPAKWAFDFLQLSKNVNNIKWGMMSMNTNPLAIELLKERMKEENGLFEASFASYKDMKQLEKIDWFKVSRNPSAIDLIREKIVYETNLIQTNPNIYELLKDYEKISYSELATNPSIFAIKRQISKPAIAPASARRTSPVQAALAIQAARPSSARPASRTSQAAQAARVAAARVANNPEHTRELENLRAFHQTLRQKPIGARVQFPQLQTVSRTTPLRAPRVYRAAPRSTRATALATRTGDRDIGRPKSPPKPRAFKRT